MTILISDDSSGFDAQARLTSAESADGRDTGHWHGPDQDPDYSKPFIPLRDRPVRAARIDPFEGDRLVSQALRPWPSPPEAVVAAEEVLREKAAVLDELTEAVLNLGPDEKAELRAFEDAIVSAAKAGKPSPTLKSTDWHSEETRRRTLREVARGEVATAAKAYDEAAKASVGDWRDSLAGQIEPSHSAALQAVQTARGEVQRWRASVKAVDEMDRAAGRFGGRWHRTAHGDVLARGIPGLTAASEMLSSDDPMVSGRYLLDGTPGSEMSPPLWTRQAMADSTDQADFWALLEIEGSEGWQVTAFTPPEQRHHYQGGPANSALREYIARKMVDER